MSCLCIGKIEDIGLLVPEELIGKTADHLSG